MDAVLFERLVRRRELAPELQRRLRLTRNTERLVRLVAAFLRGQFALPEPVDKVMTTPLLPERSSYVKDAQITLFDADNETDEGAKHKGALEAFDYNASEEIR